MNVKTGLEKAGTLRLFCENDPMDAISQEVVDRAIAIIGEIGISNDDIEVRVAGLVSDSMTARRLIDFIPEAFGLVMVSHISHGKIVAPTGFQAKNQDGQWKSFAFSSEPIFVAALQAAQTMFHHGSQNTFQAIATRSSMVTTVTNALNQGASLDGATLSGPALIGIPAEVYPKAKETLLEKFLSWRLKKTKKSRLA